MMPLCVDEKLLEKYKIIWIKIADSKNVEVNALSVYDHMYIKTKIVTFSDNICTNFRSLNLPENDIECEFFIVIFTDSCF